MSRKRGLICVFSERAYDGTNLIHKNESILLKDQYVGLMNGKKPPSFEENKFIESSICLHKNNTNVATTKVLSPADEDAELHALVSLLKNMKEEDVDHYFYIYFSVLVDTVKSHFHPFLKESFERL